MDIISLIDKAWMQLYKPVVQTEKNIYKIFNFKLNEDVHTYFTLNITAIKKRS